MQLPEARAARWSGGGLGFGGGLGGRFFVFFFGGGKVGFFWVGECFFLVGKGVFYVFFVLNGHF